MENERREPSQRAASAAESADGWVGIDPKHSAHQAEGRWIKPDVNPGKQYGIALTSIIAVTLTMWYGGVGASLTVVILGALLTNWFFISLATNSA